MLSHKVHRLSLPSPPGSSHFDKEAKSLKNQSSAAETGFLGQTLRSQAPNIEPLFETRGHAAYLGYLLQHVLWAEEPLATASSGQTEETPVEGIIAELA